MLLAAGLKLPVASCAKASSSSVHTAESLIRALPQEHEGRRGTRLCIGSVPPDGGSVHPETSAKEANEAPSHHQEAFCRPACCTSTARAPGAYRLPTAHPGPTLHVS